MGYYLMRLTRSSHVDFLVKADDYTHANDDLNDWLKEDDECKVHQLLNERDLDKISIEKYFPNIEEYNRSEELADFELDMNSTEVPVEPRYDLFLIMDEKPCHVKRKVFQNMDMSTLLWQLNHYNNSYILKRECPEWEYAKESLKNGRSAIAYKCTKRKD